MNSLWDVIYFVKGSVIAFSWSEWGGVLEMLMPRGPDFTQLVSIAKWGVTLIDNVQEFTLFTHFVTIYAYFYKIFINVHESKLIQYYIWGWGAKCITQYINSSLARNVHYEVKAKVGCLCAGRLKSRSVQNVHFDARAGLATCGCCCCHLGAQAVLSIEDLFYR